MGPETTSPPTADAEPPAPPFDPWVCPCCLGENTPLANLCVHCGAPAYGLATTGFLETGIAHGWAMGEAAARGRPSWLVSFGGAVLVSVFLLPVSGLLLWPEAGLLGPPFGVAGRIVAALFGAAALALWALVMRRLVRNFRARRAPDAALLERDVPRGECPSG